ncbi:hypothetical protein, partial [Mycobacterium avium]|uniref:hypothetical protein n=1 Tax=Mycobacterium avium TaxID=1764 RepID=UPI001E3410F6
RSALPRVMMMPACSVRPASAALGTVRTHSCDTASSRRDVAENRVLWTRRASTVAHCAPACASPSM